MTRIGQAPAPLPSLPSSSPPVRWGTPSSTRPPLPVPAPLPSLPSSSPPLPAQLRLPSSPPNFSSPPPLPNPGVDTNLQHYKHCSNNIQHTTQHAGRRSSSAQPAGNWIARKTACRTSDCTSKQHACTAAGHWMRLMCEALHSSPSRIYAQHCGCRSCCHCAGGIQPIVACLFCLCGIK